MLLYSTKSCIVRAAKEHNLPIIFETKFVTDNFAATKC